MATASERLDGIRAKIQRANHHINEFDRGIQAFRRSEPYKLVRDFDPQTSEHVFRVKVLAEPPRELSLIAGDAIHNLRSALDHLAWNLVESNGQTPTKNTYFPISETAAKYKTDAAGKVKGMSAGAISLIDAIQPYQGGCDDLWKLHKLDNIDKHCLLLVIGYGLMKGHLHISLPSGTATWDEPLSRSKMLTDGAELGRLGGASADDDMHANYDLRFQIAFGDPLIVRGEAVLPFIHELAQFVDGLIGRFRPLL